MITARNPWRYAIMEDGCFAEYMSDNNFLKRTLPITEGVNDILKNIFNMNPVRRLTLAKFRSKILALDALSIPEGDLTVEMEGEAELCGTNGQTSSVPSFKAGSPERQSNIFLCDTEADVPIRVHDQTDPSLVFTDALTVPLSDSLGSSGPESKGPITPITRAVYPPVDIPDISSAVLRDSIGLESPSVICKPQGVVANAKARWPADMFRAVIQRFKIFKISKAKPVS
jgi:hypothetical protein